MTSFTRIRGMALTCVSGVALNCALGGVAFAQSADAPARSPNEIVVTGAAASESDPSFIAKKVHLPTGDVDVANVPTSITTVPEALIINNMPRTVNDTLRYLPSVEIRDQQGLEVSRPQSRGFMGSVVQSTRMDGLSIIGTSALPAENLAGIQVLNGMSGFLYGPQPPAGVFDYQLKRPTDTTLLRAVASYESNALFTGQVDFSGRSGIFGYRVNVLHGAGESYTDGSHFNRTMVSGDFDIHVDDRTVIEMDGLHYQTKGFGLAGQITYGQTPTIAGFTIPASFNAPKGANTIPLPAAFDPTVRGYGQSYGGSDLTTNLGKMKIKRDLGGDWKFEAGGLYMDAHRGVYGIQDDIVNTKGDYVVVKNYSSAPRFTILSNLVSITGTAKVFGIVNDIAISTNGFDNASYSGLANGAPAKTNVNGIAANPNCNAAGAYGVVLGYGNLKTPTVLTNVCPNVSPTSSGDYRSALSFAQAIVVGDVMHLTSQLALHGGLSVSFLHTSSYGFVAATGTSGATTAFTPGSRNDENGLLSPTVALTYKPIPAVTLYATYASSIEQGGQSATTTDINYQQYLSPYRDREAEAGVKYQVNPAFLVTLDGFRMTQPYATDIALNTTQSVFEVIGEQRNWGAELFGTGSMTPDVSLFGGVTYIDARLEAAIPSVADGFGQRIIGVPHWKSDIAMDIHPRVADGFAVMAAFHYESDRAANNINTFYAPSYATFDLGVRKALAMWGHHETLRLNVTNVADKHYWSSIADASAIGANGADTAFAGAPRTFLASIDFDL